MPTNVPAVAPDWLAVRVRLPEPPAVNPALTVIGPVEVRLIAPLAAAVVERAPLTVRAPVWLTVTFDPAAMPPWLMPVTIRVADVLVRLIAPLVLLVAEKLPTVLPALVSVTPVLALAATVATLRTP